MTCTAQREASTIPLPASIAATWGGFLYNGLLLLEGDPGRGQQVLAAWKYDRVELVAIACTVLPDLWREITLQWNNADGDFPGVFEYAVVEPLGTWLGDYLLRHGGGFPDHREIQEELARSVSTFLRGDAGQSNAQGSDPSASQAPAQGASPVTPLAARRR